MPEPTAQPGEAKLGGTCTCLTKFSLTADEAKLGQAGGLGQAVGWVENSPNQKYGAAGTKSLLKPSQGVPSCGYRLIKVPRNR